MLLLIFESVPERIDLYVMDADHQQADNARKSNGLMINGDDLDDDHPLITDSTPKDGHE